MLGLRTIPLLALALIILTSACCQSASARLDKGAEAGKSFYLRIKDLVKHVEESGDSKNVAQSTIAEIPTERSSPHMKENGDQIMEVFPRDLRKKDKFLKHMTGPIIISHKCRKQFLRVYYSRECTVKNLLKRCVRLLQRLAGSPRCKDGLEVQ
ncbi:ALK and LTK ligand 2b-like [Sardina pilchardus]|uniref:ALK and LTK ligand 2b-like n=1 Tax=Sardina pilchardus TaxID=27697 RepID=UPI002E13DD1D